jgi:hypothetical protein
MAIAITAVVVVCLVLGGAIGFLCRGQVAMQLIVSFVVSALFFVLLQWLSGTIGVEWSLKRPLTSLAYLVGPFLGLFLLPTALVAVLSGWLWRSR